MGNRFAVDDYLDGPVLRLSNGSTDVLFDVLTIAGCHLARTPWEQRLILMFANEHRIGRGDVGFLLTELPWTDAWPAEKAFFLAVLDLAATRHGWEMLSYDPPYVAGHLEQYRGMLADFEPRPGAATDSEDWTIQHAPELLVRCPNHDLYIGEYSGCRLGDD